MSPRFDASSRVAPGARFLIEGQPVLASQLVTRAMNFGQPGMTDVPYVVALPSQFVCEHLESNLLEWAADAQRSPDPADALDAALAFVVRRRNPTTPGFVINTVDTVSSAGDCFVFGGRAGHAAQREAYQDF